MLIRRCDRCGTLINATPEETSDNAIKIGYRHLSGSFTSIKNYDLCPDCLKSLENWLKNKAPADVCTTDESKEI